MRGSQRGRGNERNQNGPMEETKEQGVGEGERLSQRTKNKNNGGHLQLGSTD